MATGRRRGRAFIYIALILILLLVLVFAVTRLGGVGLPGLSPQPEVVTAEETPLVPTEIIDTVDIVVNVQDVRRGQALSEDVLQVVAISREEYTDGIFFNSIEEVVGARARYDLKAHTPLTTALIIPQDSKGSIPSFEIPKGMVAISIPISKLSSVAYGIQKGDHVNLIATMMMIDMDTNWQSALPNRTGVIIAPGPIGEDQTNVTAILQSPEEYTVTGSSAYSYYGRIEIDSTLNSPVYLLPSEEQRPRMVSQTLIQDVVVLNLGYFPLESETTLSETTVDIEATPEETESDQVQPEPAPATGPEVATLIVSPQDAVTLNYLMLADTTINMVLRSAGDDQRIDTEAVTLQFILDQYRIPVPAKLPYGLNQRIDSAPYRIAPFPDPGALITATPPD